jgi:hypothetical protein
MGMRNDAKFDLWTKMRWEIFGRLLLVIAATPVFSQSLFINEVMSSNSQTLADIDGDFPDWIELYNGSGATLDLEDWGLSDDLDDPFKWVFPSIALTAETHLLVFASGKDRTELEEPGSHLHSNFKVSSSGEDLLLTRPDGEVADGFFLNAMPGDISFGRQPDGGESFFYFEDATPATSNNQTGYLGIAPAPEFSQGTGFYSSAFALQHLASEGFECRFTLDFTVPSVTSMLWTEDLEISENRVVRAIHHADDYIDSAPVSLSYLFDEVSDLPVFFLATDPGNFFDPDSGIYTDENCVEDWERAAHITYQDEHGNSLLAQDAGVKIFGGYSVHFRQKSLAFFARSRYGKSSFNAQLFPDLDINSFESLCSAALEVTCIMNCVRMVPCCVMA